MSPIFCPWMNAVASGSQISGFCISLKAFAWFCILKQDRGYSPPSTSRDLSQQLLLLYMLRSFSLLGSGNNSSNWLLKAKYYSKQSHIGGSISIKPAEHTVCMYCVSIKPSPPQIWHFFHIPSAERLLFSLYGRLSFYVLVDERSLFFSPETLFVSSGFWIFSFAAWHDVSVSSV